MDNDLQLYHRKPNIRFDLMKRRALAMRILEENASNGGLTYGEIAERMMVNPWVVDRWPDYNEGNARDDLAYIFGMMEQDLKELGKVYRVRQLDLLGDLITKLVKIAESDRTKDRVKIAAISAIGPLLDKEIRITNNYPSKEVNVNKRELTINLDTFLEIQKRAKALNSDLSNDDMIEGEFSEE